MPCTFLDKTGPYELPTGYHEVTTRQYLELDAQQLRTVEARASYFANRPIQVNGYVADVLAFLLHPVPVEAGLPYPSDLGQETYLQVETIRTLIVNHGLGPCYGAVYGTFVMRQQALRPAQYFDQLAAARISAASLDLPITDTYPAVAHCLVELQRLGEKYAALAEPDTTEAGRRARQAGSERLAMFGHLNVARRYAEVFKMSLGDAYQTPWETVALWLLQDRIQAEILDNLHQQKDHD